jgi:cytochrome c peroxidase
MRTWLVGCSLAVVLVACSDGSSSLTDAGSDAPPPTPDAGDAAPPPDAGTDAGDPDFPLTQQELAQLAAMTPLPAVPKDTTNAYADDAKAAALGQMLFFDKSFSGPLVVGNNGMNGGLGMVGEVGKVACASCHIQKELDDQRSKPNNVSLGTNFGTRNALGLVNSSFYAWTNWGGRFDSQWSLPTAVAENAATMNGNRLQIAHMLWTKYRTEYDAIFPVPLDSRLDPASPNAADFPPSGKPKAANQQDGPWETMAAGDRTIINRIFANYGKALAAYVRKLVSRNAAFDRYMAGDKKALGERARSGFKLFLGKGKCASCHSGPNFSDDKFHALGVAQTGPNVPGADLGRFQDVPPLLTSPFNVNGAFSDDTSTGKLTGLAQDPAMRGQFRTKGLRGVSDSAPYMHDGALATLEAVVDFYDQGPQANDAGITTDPLFTALGLAAQEKSDLVEAMKSLSGEPVPANLLVDTSK